MPNSSPKQTRIQSRSKYNSSTREVTLSGIPESVKSFNVYVTDATRGMGKVNTVKVTGGKVIFTIDSQAYTSLMTN